MSVDNGDRGVKNPIRKFFRELAPAPAPTDPADLASRLQAAERRYRALVCAVPDLVLRTNQAETATESESCTLHRSQLWGDLIQHGLPQAAVERRLAAIRRTRETGSAQAIEYELPTPKGARWYQERFAASGATEVMSVVRELTHLRNTERALRDTKERLWSLFEHVPDYIATLRCDGTFLFLNRTQPGAKLHRILRTRIYDHLPSDQAGRARQIIEQAASGTSGSFDATFASPSGEMRLYSCRVGPVKRSGEVLALTLVATDITERERALTALQESEERYRTVVENLRDAIYTTAQDGRIVDFNQAALEMFGYSRNELADLSVYATYVDRRDRDRLAAQIERSGSVRDFELKLKKKDGSVIECLVTANARRARDGTIVGYQGIIRDVTTRNRLQREVLELAAREQRRIGQDLHDGLGQHLTGLAFLSKVLAEKLASRALPEAAEAAKIHDLIAVALTETRKLARGLQPVALEAGGLGLALEELASHTSSLYGVRCTCEVAGYVDEPDSATAINVYHIAREAVTNAVKHSRSSAVSIHLSGDEEMATLTVSDDGIGIASVRSQHEGMGLHIMQYRAALIGAILSIGRQEAGGTVVSVRFATGRRKAVEEP